MSVEAGLLIVGAVSSGAAIGTALILLFTLLKIVGQVSQAAKQVHTAAATLRDQQLGRMTDVTLRFHRELNDHARKMNKLTRDLPQLYRDTPELDDDSRDDTFEILNWLNGYGIVGKQELIPEPQRVFGSFDDILRDFLQAAEPSVDTAREHFPARLVGVRWLMDDYLEMSGSNRDRSSAGRRRDGNGGQFGVLHNLRGDA